MKQNKRKRPLLKQPKIPQDDKQFEIIVNGNSFSISLSVITSFSNLVSNLFKVNPFLKKIELTVEKLNNDDTDEFIIQTFDNFRNFMNNQKLIPSTQREKEYFKQFCFLLEHNYPDYSEEDAFENVQSALTFIETRSFLSHEYYSNAIDYIAGKGKSIEKNIKQIKGIREDLIYYILLSKKFKIEKGDDLFEFLKTCDSIFHSFDKSLIHMFVKTNNLVNKEEYKKLEPATEIVKNMYYANLNKKTTIHDFDDIEETERVLRTLIEQDKKGKERDKDYAPIVSVSYDDSYFKGDPFSIVDSDNAKCLEEKCYFTFSFDQRVNILVESYSFIFPEFDKSPKKCIFEVKTIDSDKFTTVDQQNSVISNVCTFKIRGQYIAKAVRITLIPDGKIFLIRFDINGKIHF